MIVAKIDFVEICYSGDQNRHSAKIHLTGPDADLTLDCAAFLAPETPENAVASALITDAIRQVRRLPEFKAGQESLTISPGAIPEIARKLY